MEAQVDSDLLVAATRDEGEIQLLLGCVAWIALHLIVFVSWFRGRAMARSEMGILLFHGYSFIALVSAVVTAQLLLNLPTPPSVPLAALALHGIYSMTFLILWGSSDSGVSLRMLAALREGPLAREKLQAQFVRVGDDKRDSRLPSLERAGFIKCLDERYAVHHRGRVLSVGLHLLRTLNNFGSTG